MFGAIWTAVIGAIGQVASACATALIGRQARPSQIHKGSSLSPLVKANLDRAYLTVLERPIDADGLKTYSDRLKRGSTLQEIVRDLGKSPEYFERFVGNVRPEEAARLFYRHFLCRDPESEEILREHVHLLNTKGYEFIVDKLVNSDEYLKKYGRHSPPCPAGSFHPQG